MVRFVASVSERSVKCTECPGVIVQGDLRIGKGSSVFKFFHAACIFDNFARAGRGVIIIKTLDEIEGMGNLLDVHQTTIKQLFENYARQYFQPAHLNDLGLSQITPVLPLPRLLTAESSAKNNLSNLNQSSSSIPLSAGASTSVAKDLADIDKLRATGTTPADAVKGIMTCIVSGGQNNVAVPGGQNNVAVPGKHNNVVLPGMQNNIVLPGVQNKRVVQGVQNNRVVPGMQNKVVVLGVQNQVVVPGGQNSPRVSVKVQGFQNNLGALSSGSAILISSDSEDEKTAQRPVPLKRLLSALSGQNSADSPPLKKRISIDGLDECCVCLDDPVHPVSLPCGHTFCFLCAKGLVLTDRSQSPLCSLCRRPFSPNYLESAKVLDQVTKNLNETPPLIAEQNSWQWFYEGRKGWWRFEERNCEEIEENYGKGVQQFETLICGNLYTIDFINMEQYQRDYPGRKRKIKRDLKSTTCKGTAGLHKRSKNYDN